MGKQALLKRVVRRRVRRIRRDPHLPASFLGERFEVRFEPGGTCSITAAPIAQEQQRGRLRGVMPTVGVPPLAKAVTGQLTGVVTRAQVDRAASLLEVISAVRDRDPVRQTRQVMLPCFHEALRREGAGAIEIADQRFFFVSMLRSGLGPAA